VCFTLISSLSDNPTLSGCLFCFHTTVHLSRILGNVEDIGGVKIGCNREVSFVFCPFKGLKMEKKKKEEREGEEEKKIKG